MSNPLPFLRINTPSVFKSTEEQVQYFAIELNRIFEQLTRWLQDNSEQSDKVRVFGADIDLGGHRILNQENPIALTDGANRRYVDDQDDDLREQIQDILDDTHNGNDESSRSILLQRAVPTTVDDTIDIGSFLLTNDAHAFDLSITVADSSFSVAKAYTIVTQRGINAAWEIALPLVDTGAGSSQDFDLDVWQEDATSTLWLRLRRSLGTTAGTATIQITPRGKQTDQFRDASTTASVTAPVLFLSTAILTAQAGDVGINAQTLNRFGSGVALTIRGAAGADSRAHVEMENPAPGVNSVLGSLRWYAAAVLQATITARCDGATDSGAYSFFVKETGGAIALGLVLTSIQNLILGGGAVVGTNGKKVFAIAIGTPPTTSPANTVQMWAQDFTAGNAAPTFMCENTDVIQLAKGAALTASDGTLANAVVRIGELEARLTALGLL